MARPLRGGPLSSKGGGGGRFCGFPKREVIDRNNINANKQSKILSKHKTQNMYKRQTESLQYSTITTIK